MVPLLLTLTVAALVILLAWVALTVLASTRKGEYDRFFAVRKGVPFQGHVHADYMGSQPPTLEESQARLRTLMSHAFSYLDDHKVDYWLNWGSLLGQHRHDGRFIPWDDDVDIGMTEDDFERLLEIARGLPPNPWFRIVNFGLVDGEAPSGVATRKSPQAAIVSVENGKFIDIFVHSREGGMLSDIDHGGCYTCRPDLLTAARFQLRRGRPGRKRFRHSFSDELIFPLERCEFEGVATNRPGEAEALLRHIYGPGYMRASHFLIGSVYIPKPSLRMLTRVLRSYIFPRKRVSGAPTPAADYVPGNAAALDEERGLTWKQVWDGKVSEETSDEPDIAELLALGGYDSKFARMTEDVWLGYVEKIRTRLGAGKGQRVLEVGCGAGALLLPMHDYGLAVYGIDYADSLVRVCGKAMRSGTFKVAEASCIPFEEEFFDAVVSNGAFIYFRDLAYAETALREIVRVLKPKGRIALLDIPDEAKKSECLKARRDTMGDAQYNAKYRGLDHQFYKKEWFHGVARQLHLGCEIEDQKIDGYLNADFRFNVFLQKG